MAEKNTTTTVSEPKQPKTIKVNTLWKAAAIVAAVIVSFAAGSYTATQNEAAINAEVVKRVKSLGSQQ